MRFLKAKSGFIFLVAALLFQRCIGPHASLLSKKYSPAQLREDAQLLNDVILEMHPASGLYHPRDYYKQLFANFIFSLNDSLTEKQFRTRTKLVLDELHCGHTEVLYSKSFYREVKPMKFNYSPYIFLPVNTKLFVIANLNKKQDSTIRKGVEVTRINGIALDSIFKYSKRFISTDGYNQTGKDHFLQLGFNTYFLGQFGRPDTFELEYKEGKVLKQTNYAAIKLKDMPPIPLGPKDDSLFTKYRRAKIKYRFLDSASTGMLMKVEKFAHSGSSRVYRKIFKKLNKTNTENLVLDLRNNGGGSLANAYRLLTYLMDTVATQTLRTPLKNYPYRRYTHGNGAFKFTRFAFKLLGEKKTVRDTDYFAYKMRPRTKNHFGGNIFILINGGSFSASCLVAAYLDGNPRVTLIGEETGGAREGCNAGVTPYYKLPNTRIRVRVPAFRVINDVSPKITGRGIFPDYALTYSYKDLVLKRDLELLKVKELLKLK
ncbi:MAG: S41 family peptidase [bacterium]|nr:S41 family peptidase [bacterium]